MLWVADAVFIVPGTGCWLGGKAGIGDGGLGPDVLIMLPSDGPLLSTGFCTVVLPPGPVVVVVVVVVCHACISQASRIG